MKRIQYLDQMKGVAIIFVVIGHIFLFTPGASSTQVDTMLSIFHMPVFFFISGFLAYKVLPDMKSVSKRMWQKGHALLFPYIVFAGLYCLYSGKDYVKLLMGGGAEYWFLWTLFILTEFFILYEQLAGKIRNAYMYVGAWLLPYALLIVVQHRYGEVGGGILSINQLVAYYRIYLVGYLCRKYVRLNDFLFENKYVYAVCGIAFFARWLWAGSVNMLISFAGIMGAIIILRNLFVDNAENDSKAMRVLGYIGQKSLNIYVLQYFFLANISFLIPYVSNEYGFIWNFMLTVIFAIPITAASLFVGAIIERNELLRWLMLGKK